MEYKDDTITFSTGTEVYANRGFVGINLDRNSICEGLDGGIDKEELTTEERCELADHMIGRWIDFKVMSLYYDKMDEYDKLTESN